MSDSFVATEVFARIEEIIEVPRPLRSANPAQKKFIQGLIREKGANFVKVF